MQKQQAITFNKLFNLLKLLSSYEALFSSIASAYADNSAIHTAAFIPTPPQALPAPAAQISPDVAALMSRVDTLTTIVSAFASSFPRSPHKGGQSKGSLNPGRASSRSSTLLPCWINKCPQSVKPDFLCCSCGTLNLSTPMCTTCNILGTTS